jgi:hypothetical protein
MKTREIKHPDGQVSIRDRFDAAIGAYDKRRHVASVDEFNVRLATR